MHLLLRQAKHSNVTLSPPPLATPEQAVGLASVQPPHLQLVPEEGEAAARHKLGRGIRRI